MTEHPVANIEQAEAWNNEEGQHWAAHQDRYDAMSGAFTEHLLGAAAITETDTVLDIGCGNGQTTRLAAQRASRGRKGWESVTTRFKFILRGWSTWRYFDRV